MLRKFEAVIKKEFGFIYNNHRIGVAVSGGPDSVSLLLLLNALNPLKNNLVVLHYDHMLRKSAWEDRMFVNKLAKRLNLPILIGRSNVGLFSRRNHFSPEEGARIARYRFFDKAAKIMNLDFITTAHTADDQIETVILRLIRGSGIRGLRGIRSMRGIYVRPLLSFEKRDLIQFLQENNQDYRIDESNSDTRYKRNFIRANIIPLMKNMNPGLSSTIYKSSEYIGIDNQFLDKEVKKLSKQFVHRSDFYEIARKRFIGFDQAMQSRIVGYFFMLLSGSFYNPPLTFAEDAVSMIDIGSGSKTYENFRITVSCGYVAFYMDDEPEKINTVIKIGENRSLSAMSINISEHDRSDIYKSYFYSENKFIFYINASAVKGDLKIRNIRNGDYFIPFGKHRKVKIARFLIKNKIPIYFRKYIAVLYDDEKIAAVLPVQIDNRVRLSDNSKDILKIRCVIRSD